MLPALLYFQDYVQSMLALLLPVQPATGFTAPVVLYGNNVHGWVKYVFHQPIGLLKAGHVEFVVGSKTPVLGAYHPSFFLNHPSEKTLLEDLIAAAWQVAMAANPSAEPQATLDTCTRDWQGRTPEVDKLFGQLECILEKVHQHHESWEQARQECTQPGR